MSYDDEPDAEIPRPTISESVLGWLLLLAVLAGLVAYDAYTFIFGDGRLT